MDQGKAHCTRVCQKQEHGRECAEGKRGLSSYDFTAIPDKEEGEFSAKGWGGGSMRAWKYNGEQWEIPRACTWTAPIPQEESENLKAESMT